MKTETLDALITARTILWRAQPLCLSDDKYAASAGLLLVEDAVELVMIACIMERGIDEGKNIDYLIFKKLVKELRDAGLKISNGRSLTAMHNERNNVKHYGHLAEPATVRKYFDGSVATIDNLLEQVVGMQLQAVMIHEALEKGEVKDYIKAACDFVEDRKFYEAMVNVRKAIYVEIEEDYSVEGWHDVPRYTDVFPFYPLRGGDKAPWHKKNKEWIAEHVGDPLDFIQLDRDRLRVDLIEWGVATQDYWNIWRMTPEVFRFRESKEWIVKEEPKHIKHATEENARYCTRAATTILVAKQNHKKIARYLEYDYLHDMIHVKVKETAAVYSKASVDSKVETTVPAGTVLDGDYIVPCGLDAKTKFVRIIQDRQPPHEFIIGFLKLDQCEILDDSGSMTKTV